MRLKDKPRLNNLAEGAKVGHQKALFIYSGQTHARLVSGSPGTPRAATPRGLSPGRLAQSGRGPSLCFHTCLQKELPRQIQGTEGQMDEQEEEVAL